MITSERYIVLLLFSLLVILVCSGHNIPTIASGTYGSGWKHDGSGNIKSDPSRGVTSVIYNARFRDALPADTFQQQDPMADKYYPFSPYHYGACNPLLNLDFNGMDIWEVDINGYVYKIIDDKEIDEIRMVNSDGTPLLDANGTQLSVKFDYGTIEKQYSWEGLNGGQNDFWRVRGDENAQAMFEFMSDNITGSSTQVEIGWAKTGIKGDSGLNFISTSHTEKEELSIGELYKGQLCNGYTIREFIHSHPLGDGVGESDIEMKADIMYYQFKFNLNIPQFSIYHQPKKTYFNY